MKKIIYASLLAVMPGWAWAGCQTVLPSGEASRPGEPKPLVYTAPGFKLSFNPNVPRCMNLVSKKVDFINAEGGYAYCAGGFRGVDYLIWRGSKVSDCGSVYTTGIPGVGIAVSTPGGPHWPVRGNMGALERITVPPGTNSQLMIQFIKIGPITSGGVISGELGRMYGNDGYDGPLFSWRFDAVVIDPQVPTCRVTTPAIAVPLGSMPASTFTGVGTPSPSKPFNIELECSGIDTGKSLNVYTTLTDHTNPGNVSDTLTLAKDSTATGIGIQVLNGSTVVKYGPDSGAIGNKNQWKAGAAGNGAFTIPLTARYIQTAPKMTPGTANGLATFTMSYK